MLDDPFFPDLFELVETQCVRDSCGKPAASREHWPHCSAECAKADLLARARIAREQARAAVQWCRELVRQLEETLRGGGQASLQTGCNRVRVVWVAAQRGHRRAALPAIAEAAS